MVGYNFITLEQLIATYMVKFKTTVVSKKEVNRWARHYAKKMNNEEIKSIIFFNEQYVKNENDVRKLFISRDDMYYLANGVKRSELDAKILSYMHVDLLMKMFMINDFIPKYHRITDQNNCLDN